MNAKRKPPHGRGPTPRRQPPLARPSRPPGDFGPPVPLRTSGGGLLDMPPLAGPADPALATAYVQAFFDLEEWFSAGKPPGKLDLATLPREHRVLAGLDGPAFEYYRSCMLGLFEQAVLWRPAVAAIRSLLARARGLDPAGYDAFIEQAWGAHPRFAAQRNNAYRQLRALPEHPGQDDDVRHRLRTQLKAWADYYEVDFVLWFLGVLGKGLTGGAVRPGAFGGPDTTTAQGSLADQVGEALAGTPLQALHITAYDRDLGNVARHNDYGVDGHTRADALDKGTHAVARGVAAGHAGGVPHRAPPCQAQRLAMTAPQVAR